MDKNCTKGKYNVLTLLRHLSLLTVIFVKENWTNNCPKIILPLLELLQEPGKNFPKPKPENENDPTWTYFNQTETKNQSYDEYFHQKSINKSSLAEISLRNEPATTCNLLWMSNTNVNEYLWAYFGSKTANFDWWKPKKVNFRTENCTFHAKNELLWSINCEYNHFFKNHKNHHTLFLTYLSKTTI